MKYAVHILLIQLFICNRCKVRIIMWFNCFNSSHQLNNHIFLSRPSRTSVCDDTNLSLYNFPSLFLSSSTVDVIHSLPSFLTLFVFLSCVSSLSLSSLIISHPPGSMSPCTVSVSAPSINWGHLYVHARTLGPGSARMRIRFGAGCPGQDISECVHYTQPGQYPDIIHPSSLSSNTQKPENNF